MPSAIHCSMYVCMNGYMYEWVYVCLYVREYTRPVCEHISCMYMLRVYDMRSSTLTLDHFVFQYNAYTFICTYIHTYT